MDSTTNPTTKPPMRLRELIAQRTNAVLKACNVAASVTANDIRRGPTSKMRRDDGCFVWFVSVVVSVGGTLNAYCIGSQLTMRACARGPLLVEYEPITYAFHLYPRAEWPPGITSPARAAFGVRYRLGGVQWHDAEGNLLPSDQSRSEESQ